LKFLVVLLCVLSGFSVEVPNSYSEEKEDALSALGELATNTGSVGYTSSGYKIFNRKFE